jgi:hypothetical protein
VPKSPFADGEVLRADNGAQARQNCQSALHRFRPKSIDRKI